MVEDITAYGKIIRPNNPPAPTPSYNLHHPSIKGFSENFIHWENNRGPNFCFRAIDGSRPVGFSSGPASRSLSISFVKPNFPFAGSPPKKNPSSGGVLISNQD